MDMQEQALAQAKVMMAFANGEKLKMRARGDNTRWEPCLAPVWQWASFEYAVDREPRTFWLNVYPDGSVGGPHASREDARGTARNWNAPVELPEPWQCETHMCPALYTAEQVHACVAHATARNWSEPVETIEVVEVIS